MLENIPKSDPITGTNRAYSLVIQERRILFGVQHLEQGTGWVTIVSPTNFVNLINEHQRILGTDTLECLNNLSRQGSVTQLSILVEAVC